ncbi:MAG: LysR family transcriptional regulator substrate-binding protein, partial [Gammaproteobacteria bacterium]|nr:LysR family transcriptional regulator substrate-binding protein [Gammaproteobacteria bacterium]
GIAPSAYQVYINGPLEELVKAYPGMQLELVVGSAEQLAPRVISGDLDVLWGAARPLTQWPELKVTVLRDLYYGFMIRRGHPLTKLKKIGEADLLNYPILLPATVQPIHIDVARRYAPNGLPPMHPRYVTDDFELTKSIVASTDAFSHVASLSPKFAERLKRFVILDGVVNIPPQQLAYAVAATKAKSPAVEAFEAVVSASIG